MPCSLTRSAGSYRHITAGLFNVDMLALADTAFGNGMVSLAFGAMTVGAFLTLSWMKHLPEHRATRKGVQLTAFVLAMVALVALPVALESFFRIWDPSYVYNGS